MKKLSLDLEQLAVESFDTSDPRRHGGTVRAFGFSDTTCQQIICDCPTGGTCDSDCGQDTCGNDTCGDSCINICPPTNHGERTCNRPSCFYSCGCPSYPDQTACCIG